jgi:glycine amidinotransferase/scyllo-inosamine-4-phosphate amidinotransferase 1
MAGSPGGPKPVERKRDLGRALVALLSAVILEGPQKIKNDGARTGRSSKGQIVKSFTLPISRVTVGRTASTCRHIECTSFFPVLPADNFMLVNAHTEWEPLREIIIGIASGAQIPTVKDQSLHSIENGTLNDEEFVQVRSGPYPRHIIEETNEDLDRFADDLAAMGIKVHRPPVTDFTSIYKTDDWAVDGYHAYCPRDVIFTVGNQAIESPMVLRHRQDEARIYRDIVETVRPPLPRLLDDMYDRSVLGQPTLMNKEPAFDAANLLKIGRDIMFLISNTGNDAGCDWLQQYLGSQYRVHPVRDVYAFIHIDSTILPLRPGLVLCCPKRINDENIPEFFRSWEKIYAPEPIVTPFDAGWNPASEWIAMNILSLSPELVVVEKNQTNLMRLLKKYGIESYPLQLRHMRTMGGGPHCVSLDLVRDGTLEDYS